MYDGSQIINQFHGSSEKNKYSNVIWQHQVAVLSVFSAVFSNRSLHCHCHLTSQAS